ncbi:MAG: hypothetical protein M0R77_03060 [Gammaproteobacteria bacterium]|nr:hypothetical protein [Gammaproteobacteria bacterium]
MAEIKTIMNRRFENCSKASEYFKELKDLVAQLGFDTSIVKTYDEYEYRCSHRYHDYTEVYIMTDDPVIITALTLVD